MNTRELEYLLMIAKEQSISRAAEKLYVTQPALSLFLTRLESGLGTELFSRTQAGLLPTYAGERYISMAQKILKNYRDFEQELCEINMLQRGRLNIGASAHIGSLVLPQVLPAFNRLYPNIEVSIHEGSSKVLEQLLEENAIDAALMHLPLKTAANYTEIKRERYVMAFSRDHRLNQFTYEKPGESYPFIDVKAAAGEKFVLSFPWQRVRQISDRILEKAGIEPEIILTTSSVQTALRFAGVGLGVTFLPETYIQLFQNTYDPIFCYMEDIYEAGWTFVIAYPRGVSLSGPARAFVDLVRDQMTEEGA
ncbi:MAG: LysR family transcriptional regulator [Eubacteriales bacterium]|nr:LysR family transcriptional regulator [Eubacteriales bacterium]